jgi:hypothetical protein
LFAACATMLSEVSAQNATFTTQQYPLLGNNHVAADFNGDGLDLAGAGSNAVSVMLNNGAGTFGPKTDFAIAAQTQAVAAGDFNNDGIFDTTLSPNPTVTHLYPDEVNVTAVVRAVRGSRSATDSVTFSALRCQ